jgi:hypothetical protein
LLADLREQPETLLMVKPGHALRELLDGLPESVEFVTRGREGLVTVGCLRARGTEAVAAGPKRGPVPAVPLSLPSP